MERRQRVALVKKVEGEEHLRDMVYVRLMGEMVMKTYLHAPNGLVRENAETAIACWGPGPARKKRIPVVERREKMHRCALAAKKNVEELTL